MNTTCFSCWIVPLLPSVFFLSWKASHCNQLTTVYSNYEVMFYTIVNCLSMLESFHIENWHYLSVHVCFYLEMAYHCNQLILVLKLLSFILYCGELPALICYFHIHIIPCVSDCLSSALSVLCTKRQCERLNHLFAKNIIYLLFYLFDRQRYKAKDWFLFLLYDFSICL